MNFVNVVRSTLNFIQHSKNSEKSAESIISPYFIALVMFVQFKGGEYKDKKSILNLPDQFCELNEHSQTFNSASLMRKHGESNNEIYFITDSFCYGLQSHLANLMQALTRDLVME